MRASRAKASFVPPTIPTRSVAPFIVKGYGPHDFNNPSLITTHSTEMSAFVEIEALQRRMKRHNGSVVRAELIDCRPDGRLTNMNVHRATQIEWSWAKKE